MARKRIDGLWTLCYRQPNHSVHNHEAQHSSAFIEHRRLNPEKKNRARELLSTGVQPKQIGLILRGEDPSVSASLRDIYNIRAEAVREERHGQPPAQALINNLTQDQTERHIFFPVSTGYFEPAINVVFCRL